MFQIHLVTIGFGDSCKFYNFFMLSLIFTDNELSSVALFQSTHSLLAQQHLSAVEPDCQPSFLL